MPCVSPLKGFKDPWTGGLTFDRSNTQEEMDVACGQCLGCRIDWRRMWSMRIAHEASLHEYSGGNSFITLTYRDPLECTPEQWIRGDHVPSDWSLNPRHWELFMKRLRKFFEPQQLRFFAAGEYGRKCKHGVDLRRVSCPLCRVGRPHFHAIIFNGSFPDLVSYQSDGNITRWTSPTLERIWRYGFVDVAPFTYNAGQYVAGYILKKMSGARSHDQYLSVDLDGVITWLEPEFVRMSRNPGVGRVWFEKYFQDVFPSDEVPVPGKGVFRGVPRFYEECYAEVFEAELEEIKKVREAFMREHADDYTPERLMDKYKCMVAKQKLFESEHK